MNQDEANRTKRERCGFRRDAFSTITFKWADVTLDLPFMEGIRVLSRLQKDGWTIDEPTASEQR